MLTPPRTAIQARILDLRADALHQSDATTVRQLDRLTKALDAGMLFCWNDDGDLCIASASTPGQVYTASRHGCTCEARKPCKHLALRSILLEMFDEAATDADIEADCDEAAPQPWIIGALFRRLLDRSMGARLSAARVVGYTAWAA